MSLSAYSDVFNYPNSEREPFFRVRESPLVGGTFSVTEEMTLTFLRHNGISGTSACYTVIQHSYPWHMLDLSQESTWMKIMHLLRYLRFCFDKHAGTATESFETDY